MGARIEVYARRARQEVARLGATENLFTWARSGRTPGSRSWGAARKRGQAPFLEGRAALVRFSDPFDRAASDTSGMILGADAIDRVLLVRAFFGAEGGEVANAGEPQR